MSDIIQLSSDDEGHKGKSDNGVLKCKGSKLSESTGASGESWSTFQKFLKTCYDTEVTKRKGNSKSMTAIMEKLSRRFKNADPKYTQTEAFIEAVKSVQRKVETDPRNLFVHMKEIGDELKLRCVKSKNIGHKRKLEGEGNTPSKRPKIRNNDASEDEEGEQGYEVNKRHCKKLELLFEKVYRRVKKLEEKEVDWDKEENSEYIRLERHKSRLYAIWEKWQEARGRKDEVKKLGHRKIAFSGSLYPELDHAIEKFVNKTRCFPDFIDIYKLTSETLNKDKGVQLDADQIKSIASAAFQIIGNQLKKVRVYDFWNSCQTYFPTSDNSNVDASDPANQNEDLARALEENKKNYSNKLSDVINTFVVKQIDGNHEPVEVDGEGSAPSGDDEEEEQENEDPEDIICLSSSSSENSDDETKTIMKEQKIGIDEKSSNGNLTELENKMKPVSKIESEKPADYISLSTRSQEKSPVCLGKVKMEASDGAISVESCSSVKNKSEHPSPSTSSGNKKSKSRDRLEIVILSESDSG